MHARSLIYGLAVSLALAPAAPRLACAQARTIDDLVVASVNGEEVTRRHVVARLIDYRGEETLEKMISRAILRQEAKRLGLSVTDDEVNTNLQELQARFKSESDYHAFLTSSRLKEAQLREEFRNTLLVQKVATKSAPVKESDLEQYDVRMIVAPDQKTAEQWIKELTAKPEEFNRYAAERSVDRALRPASGHLKPFLKIEMLDVAGAVDEQKLQPRQFTKTPVQLGNGNWVIIKLEERVPVTVASAAERERLQTMVTSYRVQQWLAQARAAAKVQKKPLSEAVVATVNGESISRPELVSRLLEFHGDETLQQMSNRALLLQAAKQQKVDVAQAEADKKFEEFRGRFKTPDDFQAFLTRSNLTEKQLRDELRFTELMARVALKESPITDDDLRQYSVRMVVAPTKKAAEEGVKELDEGKIDFARLAAERSQDPQGRQAAGMMRPFVKVELLDLWRAVDEQKLKPGGYTKQPVLLTDNTWVLLKLEDVIPASKHTAEERKRLTELITRYRVEQWLIQARARAKIGYPVPLATVVREPKS